MGKVLPFKKKQDEDISRIDRIKSSLSRINKLMDELRRMAYLDKKDKEQKDV